MAGLRLPRLYAGQLLKALDRLRLQYSINAIEADMGLMPTAFQPFYQGQLLCAADLNALSAPIGRLRNQVNLETTFKNYPVSEGMLLEATHLNELVDLINEAIDAWLPQRTSLMHIGSAGGWRSSS